MLPPRIGKQPTWSLGVLLLLCAGWIFIAASPVAAADPAWHNEQPAIVPTPKTYRATGRAFALPKGAKIVVTAPQRPTLQIAAQTLCDWFRKHHAAAVELAVADAPAPPADAKTAAGTKAAADLCVVLESHADAGEATKTVSGAYRIRVASTGSDFTQPMVTIAGDDDLGALYGAYTLLKSLRRTDTGVSVPEIQVDDEPVLSVRGFSPQWAWYLGQRGPYGAALWRLPEWKRFLDLMTEYRMNMLALCTYGRFPMRLPGHESLCAVDLPFEIWDADQGLHTIRWTHPVYENDFFNELIDYAHQRGIRVLIYTCMNLQDDAGTQQWSNEAELQTYCDIFQQILRQYRIDGFILESGEYQLTHADDLARFGQDQWSRMKADLFLTHRFNRAMREVKPNALLGLVDHYLFMDWDAKGVSQRTGLERWKAELPADTLLAYVASPEAYEVFPSERVWTYVFGPKGGLKPALQIHLADCCDVPRAKQAGGAYYVSYDFSPHEVDYLCFAESAWGNYGGSDNRAFVMHSSEPGVGGPISGRVWNNIVRDCYGEGSSFGDGLLTACKGTPQALWDPRKTLHRQLPQEIVPPLKKSDFAAVDRLIAEVKDQEENTAQGLCRMLTDPRRRESTMITDYPMDEPMQKAIHLARVQQAWLRFVQATYETARLLAENADQPQRRRQALEALRGAGKSAHGEIRDALDKAYFHYPHDKLGKFEFLADPKTVAADLAPHFTLNLRASAVAKSTNRRGAKALRSDASVEAASSAQICKICGPIRLKDKDVGDRSAWA